MVAILSKLLILLVLSVARVSARNLRFGDTKRELALAADRPHLSVLFSAKNDGLYSHRPRWWIERADGKKVAESARVKFKEDRSVQDVTLPGGGKYRFRVANAADDEIAEEDAEAIGFQLVLADDAGSAETGLAGEWISGGGIGEFEVKRVSVQNFDKIQKFTIEPHNFSVQTGEMTATLELRKSVVDEMYKKWLEDMGTIKYICWPDC